MDWSFLSSSTNLINLIRNITVVILLQITEQLTEPFFTCQCNKNRNAFVGMYFITPAVAFSTLALSLEGRKIFTYEWICKGCEKTSLFFCKLLYPAVCWVIILLIDGKYLGCALYNRCNNTVTTVSNSDPEMIYEIIKSKVIGFSMLLACLLIYVLFLVGNCLRSPAYRYERMYLSQLDKEREEFAKEYMKMCSKNRATLCETSLSRKTEGKPEDESTTPPGAESPAPPGAESTTQPEVRRKTGLDLINEEDTKTIMNEIEKHFNCNIQHPADNSPAPSENTGSASSETSSTAKRSNESPAPSGPAVRAHPELGSDIKTQEIQMMDMIHPLIGKSSSNKESLA
ncbi:hypothetical protein GJAV_G00105370 [Gymnothorax javanicus]|nr:hypothetical protein GJAV_G00105370 [Gymnothorax javanicus]